MRSLKNGSIMLFMLLICFTAILNPVGAVSGKPVTGIPSYISPADYKAGGFRLNQLTEDRFFQAPNGMTPGQIQQFLERRNSVLAGLLPVFRYSPSNQLYRSGIEVKPSVLIYEAQQKYRIHAAIILTLLQKEQGLLHIRPGAVQPFSRMFVYAMGYGATDRGDLLNMSGFDRQIELSARRMRQLFDEAPKQYPYRMAVNAGKAVVYNGKSYPPMIDVSNRASYVLYRYTPWTFDPALLPSLGGGNLLFMQVFRREFS